jgi:hypothetical protein
MWRTLQIVSSMAGFPARLYLTIWRACEKVFFHHAGRLYHHAGQPENDRSRTLPRESLMPPAQRPRAGNGLTPGQGKAANVERNAFLSRASSASTR